MAHCVIPTPLIRASAGVAAAVAALFALAPALAETAPASATGSTAPATVPASAPAAADFSSNTPEAATRRFVRALFQGQEAEIRKTIVRPDADGVEILWAGSEKKLAALLGAGVASGMKFRRVDVGEKIGLTPTKTLEVTDDFVNEDRALLMADGWPLPFILLRVEGTWLVDAGPIIAARRAAKAVKDRAATRDAALRASTVPATIPKGGAPSTGPAIDGPSQPHTR